MNNINAQCELWASMKEARYQRQLEANEAERDAREQEFARDEKWESSRWDLDDIPESDF